MQPGDMIAKRYRVVRAIGAGGMGSVAIVEDTKLSNIKYACKEVSADVLAIAGGLDMFKTEATTLMGLKHSHIVGYRGFEQVGKTFYLLTELVEGKSLDDLLNSGRRFSEQETIDIIVQVLSGLSYAHQKNVVHRDMKPSNVMLNGPDATIIDFGIAKASGASGNPGHTMMVAKGAYTPFYGSPEQASGEVTTARSDLYSVGVMIYDLVTHNVRNVFEREPYLRRGYDRVSRLPGLSPDLERVVLRAVAVDPRNRYASAQDMADALRALSPGGFPATPPAPMGPINPQPNTPLPTTLKTTSTNSPFDIRKKG
jgi:eukaryotic-like serine/threonine-protein kinase